jgi:predicted nucleic acid-binding protein
LGASEAHSYFDDRVRSACGGKLLSNIKRPSTVCEFVEGLKTNPVTHVIPCDSDLFYRGLMFFASRLDKEWSLTDWISFVVMQEQGIIDVLTDDHHFEQAGFNALL